MLFAGTGTGGTGTGGTLVRVQVVRVQVVQGQEQVHVVQEMVRVHSAGVVITVTAR